MVRHDAALMRHGAVVHASFAATCWKMRFIRLRGRANGPCPHQLGSRSDAGSRSQTQNQNQQDGKKPTH